MLRPHRTRRTKQMIMINVIIDWYSVSSTHLLFSIQHKTPTALVCLFFLCWSSIYRNIQWDAFMYYQRCSCMQDDALYCRSQKGKYIYRFGSLKKVSNWISISVGLNCYRSMSDAHVPCRCSCNETVLMSTCILHSEQAHTVWRKKCLVANASHSEMLSVDSYFVINSPLRRTFRHYRLE